jgi:uncharacterized membrane protein YgcG
MKKIFFLFAILFLGLVMVPFSYGEKNQSTERILSFHSDIQVYRDATMTAVETITVYSTGNQIKRGIYRDFPTRYKDRYGNNYVVDFSLNEVLRDGKPENYHFEDLSNGTRVYIGSKDVFLKQGTYTYTIRYSTNRQLGFFKDHDELYWNVTGNGWSFPIEIASAAIRLPDVTVEKILEMDAYTGFAGEKGKDFFSSTRSPDTVFFQTRRPLSPNEGLTVVVQWPKGYVAEPTMAANAQSFIRDNRGTVLSLLGLCSLLVYYFLVWFRYGKDPSKGTIIPLYEPPGRFSPASMRFIANMGFDNKTFSAAIINMAVKGYITIHEENDEYTLVKTGASESVLSREEQVAARRLFPSSATKMKVGIANRTAFHGALVELQRSLQNNLEKIYFTTNRKYFIVGLCMSFLVIIASSALGKKGATPAAIFMSFWLTGWTFGVALLLMQVVSLWKSVISAGTHSRFILIRAIFLSMFALPFVFAEIGGIVVFAFTTSLYVLMVVAMMIFLNILFYQLMRAPTLTGRKILDKIEGFKMYLSIAEKERLNLLNTPDKTPELFEKYLPYAFALDVEQEWSEQFSDVLSKAYGPSADNAPRWYSGPSWHTLGASAFTSSLGSSLTTAVSSAASSSSSSPGSSSGGGGGGSSGGGGGGGGGGGW